MNALVQFLERFFLWAALVASIALIPPYYALLWHIVSTYPVEVVGTLTFISAFTAMVEALVEEALVVRA